MAPRVGRASLPPLNQFEHFRLQVLREFAENLRRRELDVLGEEREAAGFQSIRVEAIRNAEHANDALGVDHRHQRLLANLL